MRTQDSGLGGPELYSTVKKPSRMMVMGSSEPAWFQATPEEQEQVIPVLRKCFSTWVEWGAKLLCTFDDDLLMTGTPRARNHSFYLVYEVESLELASAMIQLCREPLQDNIRLNHYFRFEAMLGRDFFPAE